MASFKQLFTAKLNLLQVITPDNSEDDHNIDDRLDALKDNCKVTENATIFQGLLEHFQSNNPDMLCVIRRKRGFFKKIWKRTRSIKKNSTPVNLYWYSEARNKILLLFLASLIGGCSSAG